MFKGYLQKINFLDITQFLCNGYTNKKSSLKQYMRIVINIPENLAEGKFASSRRRIDSDVFFKDLSGMENHVND